MSGSNLHDSSGYKTFKAKPNNQYILKPHIRIYFINISFYT